MKVKVFAKDQKFGIKIPNDLFDKKDLSKEKDPDPLGEVESTTLGSIIYMRASGNSIPEEGIFDGDILVVDRELQPNNNLVVAIMDGEFSLKRVKMAENKLYLMSENKDNRPIEISPTMDFILYGVVLYIIHKV